MNSSIRKTLGIVTAVLAVCAGAGLIAAAISLYRSGSAAAGGRGMYSAAAIGERFRVIAPVLYAFLVSAAAGIVLRACSAEERTIAAPRQIMKGQPDDPAAVRAARVAIAVAAVILIILGVTNGGMRDVLVKAQKICMECIGLG